MNELVLTYCVVCDVYGCGEKHQTDNKKKPQRYDLQFLQTYCDENKVKLIGEYEKVTMCTKIKGNCIGCEKIFEKGFGKLVNDGGPFCTECTKQNSKEKTKNTNLKRYGVKYPSQSKEIREKSKQTCLQRYGVEYPLQSEEIMEKGKQTCLEHYGVKCSLQSKEIREKIKQTWLNHYGVKNPSQSEEVKERGKQTCLERYGVEYPFQFEEFKEKGKQTCLEHYGVEYPLQSKEVREKIKQTNLERYGVENPFQSKEFKEKGKQTCLKNYGVEYPSQNPVIFHKSRINSFAYKPYECPSKTIIQIQGYEHFALDELFQIYPEDNIVTGVDTVPIIKYIDEKGKNRSHYPDIYIISEHRCIEVKSTWTFNKNNSQLFIKQKTARDNGYLYEMWVYDRKGNKTVY